MKNFKDFNLKPNINGFVGEKISINRILNKEIIVEKFKIEESKFKNKGHGKCLGKCYGKYSSFLEYYANN